MTDEEFIQMIHELVRKEEQRLCLNSELFFRRHNEIMELIRKVERKE